MELWWAPILAVSLLLLVPHTHQEEQGLRLGDQALAGDGSAVFDLQKEDELPEEEEPMRRARNRNQKRRRRLRKRYRTTTEPSADELNENLNVAEQNPDVAYEQHRLVEEGSTGMPPSEETTRKRGAKRRRRPHRKYQQDSLQDNQGVGDSEAVQDTPKPPRRRRKGGRRRGRPHIETTEPNKIELYIETTALPQELAEVTTMMYTGERMPESTLPTPQIEPEVIEVGRSPIYRGYDSRNNLISQPSVQLVVENARQPDIHVEEEPEPTSTVLPSYSSRPVIDSTPNQEPAPQTKLEDIERQEILNDRETNEVPSQAPTETSSFKQPDYGNKIFDRKSLFSKSRRLPETSAVIRKKLFPRRQNDDRSTVGKEQKLLIPEGFTVQPQTVEPSKLLEKLTAHSKSYRTTTTTTTTQMTITTTEEPNYPKFESRKEKLPETELVPKTTTELATERFNRVVELHRSRGKVLMTTAQYEEPTEGTTINEQIAVTEPVEPDQQEQLANQELTTVLPNNLNLDVLNLRKLNDSIIELLKSESGNLKLSEILESRNMTLAQLLEHRERGASNFHLSEMFAERKSLEGENTTAGMDLDKEEPGTPVYVEKQTILFPSQDVLGSFPAFMSDTIEGGLQKSKDPSTVKPISQLENREPRVFDSLPEFVSNAKEERPVWKLSHPKLRPVSERGDFEEIRISLQPSNKVKIGADEDQIVLLSDKAEILRTNRVASDSAASQEVGSNKFRRIPVTVKSAIIISVAILILAIFGFLSVLISCRLRQKKARLRAKQDILCEHLKTEDFMNSQQSLSPVLTKQQQRGPVFTQNANVHTNTAPTRHYYLWRTLRKTFQYD